MMITYKSRFLTRAEVWYDNEPGDTRPVDWILYQQRSHAVRGTKSSYFYTYIVDLTQKREQLQANLNSDTAYKIRRGRERDKVLCECCDPRDTATMNRFEEMYNVFAESKGRVPLNRARLDSMAAAGVLDLTVARDPEGNTLVYHANYQDSRRATSLELPSLYRKQADNSVRSLISRANRLLTWNNLMRYQELGLEIFDFGGWYPGSADQARLDINRFKEGFGGQVRREYQCEQVLTLKGRAVLATGTTLSWARKLLQSSQAKPDIARSPGTVPAQANPNPATSTGTIEPQDAAQSKTENTRPTSPKNCNVSPAI